MSTIREIASIAGVSPGAVSRILNQDKTLSVSDATRNRVFSVAQELKYEGRKLKKTVRPISEKQKTFGILQWYSASQELEDSYYLSIRMGVEKYCMENNILVRRAFKSDSDYISSLDDIDGMICIGKFGQNELSCFQKITDNYILVDMQTERISHPSITVDFEHAIIDVIDYLYHLGHRKIGYLGGLEYIDDGQLYFEQRKATFERYCTRLKIEYKPYMLESAYSIESGYEMMNQLIGRKTLPTALFTASDSLALGAMRALNEHKIKVPADLSLVGFNNIDAAAYSTPPLTTVNAPTQLMGACAANFLATGNRLHTSKTVPLQMILPCQLIKRASCSIPQIN
ncbi:MAG: LacI family DNA-binding transcriptional regulator [Clostridia bacterium]|nr:LacI family DNA-binding transcriptional regulator [Clostridia bacterium]